MAKSFSCESEHQVIDSESFLDKRLFFNENYVKIEACGEHISSLYDRVEDYLLYRYFQRLGNDLLSDLGVNV